MIQLNSNKNYAKKEKIKIASRKQFITATINKKKKGKYVKEINNNQMNKCDFTKRISETNLK